MRGDELPIVDACWVSSNPGAGWVMARDASEPPQATRRFPIVDMLDADGDSTSDACEAKAVVFGSDAFGWCVYELTDDEPEPMQ